MTEIETLASYFPDWESSGAIFAQMSEMPWAEYIDGTILDIMYLASYSGIKIPTQFVKHFSTNHEANSIAIATYLKKLFYKSWEHLWNAYIAEYSPTESLNVSETEIRDLDALHTNTETSRVTDDGSDTLTLNTTNQNSGSESLAHGLRETTDYDNTTTVTDNTTSQLTHGLSVSASSTATDSTFGFNTDSSSPIPTAKSENTSTQTNSGTDTTRNTGTTSTVDDSTNIRALTGTDTTTTTATTTNTGTETTAKTNTHTESNSESGSKNEDEEITRTRHGNVGNHSFSELIAAEFETWKYKFFNQVFDDVDSVLTLQVHNPSATL